MHSEFGMLVRILNKSISICCRQEEDVDREREEKCLAFADTHSLCLYFLHDAWPFKI